MTLKDFLIITAFGLMWTVLGVLTWAWLLIPLAASYTAMMWTIKAERTSSSDSAPHEPKSDLP